MATMVVQRVRRLTRDVMGHLLVDIMLVRSGHIHLEVIVKLSISEARKQLPTLVRRVQRDGGTRIQITVHDQVVAELRAVQPEPAPGAAARTLLDLMNRFRKRQGRPHRISSRVKEHL